MALLGQNKGYGTLEPEHDMSVSQGIGLGHKEST